MGFTLRRAAIALLLLAGLAISACEHRHIPGTDVPIAAWHDVTYDCTTWPFAVKVRANPVLQNVRGYASVTCIRVDAQGDDAWHAGSFYELKLRERNWETVVLDHKDFARFRRLDRCVDVGVFLLDADNRLVESGGPPATSLVYVVGMRFISDWKECDVFEPELQGVPRGPVVFEPATRR